MSKLNIPLLLLLLISLLANLYSIRNVSDENIPIPETDENTLDYTALIKGYGCSDNFILNKDIISKELNSFSISVGDFYLIHSGKDGNKCFQGKNQKDSKYVYLYDDYGNENKLAYYKNSIGSLEILVNTGISLNMNNFFFSNEDIYGGVVQGFFPKNTILQTSLSPDSQGILLLTIKGDLLAYEILGDDFGTFKETPNSSSFLSCIKTNVLLFNIYTNMDILNEGVYQADTWDLSGSYLWQKRFILNYIGNLKNNKINPSENDCFKLIK